MTPSNSRVLVVSQRSVRPVVSNAGGYEFEDVVRAIDDVDLLVIETEEPNRFPLEQKMLSRIRRHTGIDAHREPRRKEAKVTKPYDLFFMRIMSPTQLDILESVKGWQENCQTKVCWIEELWPNWIEHAKWLQPLRQFDHVFVLMRESPDPLSRAIGRPCSFMPPGVDALRFCPYPNPPSRSIDFYAMGRRSPITHRSLLAYAEQREDFTYLYDSARPTTFVEGPAEHRELLASLIKRSRFFLANRAKAGAAEQTKGAQAFGPRFFEGAAAGALLVGTPPECTEFGSYFDWPDALVPIEYGSERIGEVIDELDADPDRVRRARQANITNVLRRHDWAHRWQTVLAEVGLSPLQATRERETRLERRAQEVESAG
jgi:hypothetical protein